jgi:hypothetical protein
VADQLSDEVVKAALERVAQTYEDIASRVAEHEAKESN